MGLYLIAATHWSLDPNTYLAILMVVAGLGFVIFVHELGHFLAAKSCGVKCEKFYVGFDVPIKIGPFRLPSALWKRQWGETEYGIGILPLGGYVKMLGQDDDPRNAAAENERIKLQKPETVAKEAESVVKEMVPAPSGERSVELDPRSFPAKPVWQRMIIISAGVIVNLIFAVIFAAFAFRSGVPYTPTVIGAAVPGAPAWLSGIQQGDRIMQIGRKGKPSEHLRYDWDLVQNVAIHDHQETIDLLIRRADGREEWLNLRLRKVGKQSMMGVVPMGTLDINDKNPVEDNTPASTAGFEGGEKIVAVNGQPVTSYPELSAVLWQHLNDEIVVTVERPVKSAKKSNPPTTERVDIKVAPNPRKSLGLVMAHSPISAIRPGSPAAKAGLKEGDLIESIQGEPFGDPVTLSERLQPWFGKEVELAVKRPGQGKDAESLTIKITPEAPTTPAELQSFGSTLGVPPLGIAFPILRTLQDVVPGTPAAEKGLQAGDKITKVQCVVPEPLKKKFARMYDDTVLELDDEFQSWLPFENRIQNVPSEISMKLTVVRGKEEKTVEVKPQSSSIFTPSRGIILNTLSETHVAESWPEAFSLGVRQTKEDALRVTTMLNKLATGKVALTNLAGPPTIFAAAVSEAMRGWTRLLIFLTMLSANLAVLNFLPIPALDGGHMMFLLWEGIFRKPVNERVQIGLTMAGVLCLLSLMVFVFGLDIWRFINIFS